MPTIPKGPEWTIARQVVCTLFHVLAILSTSFRLFYRLYTRLLWLEDACAALALIGDCFCLALVWIHWPYGRPGPNWPQLLRYIVASLPADVLWMARLSILISIIRMTNPRSPQRRLAFATTGLFILFWFGIFVQRMIRCAHAWCGSDKVTGILQIISAILADVPLVGLPIWSFRESKLPRDRKVTVVAVYVASIVITVAVLFDSIEAILPDGDLALLSMYLKPALSLTVSNLFVITSYSWRLLGGGDRRPQDRSPNAMTFTTVDLGTCDSGTIPTAMDMVHSTTTESTTNNSNLNYHELAISPLADYHPADPPQLNRFTPEPSCDLPPETRWPSLPSACVSRGGGLALAGV